MSAITHEGDVQRQHARVRIPLKIEINRSVYKATDWSIGGAGLEARKVTFKPGREVSAKLIFPFDNFGLDLTVRARVRYVDEAKGHCGLQFVDLTPRQVSVLRFVLDASLSGEIVDAGDLLEVAARQNEVKPRSSNAGQEMTRGQKARRDLKRLGQATLAIAASAALLWFVGASVYDRLFVIPATSAMVTADLVTIPATVGGSVAFMADGSSVKRGEPIAAIEGMDGRPTYVNSPCDCVVQTRYNVVGDFVAADTPLIALRRTNAKPYVAAFISQSDALRVLEGARVTVVLADGREIEDASPRLAPSNDPRTVEANLMKIVVDLGDEIDPAAIGQPARVRFETKWPSVLGLRRLFG